MGKKLFSLCMALALCLSLLPATALAVDEDVPDTLLVGGTNVKGGGYWTTNSTTGELTQSSESESWNVYYDTSNNTLTLKDADITGAASDETSYLNVGIYASSSSGDVSLNIVLQDKNTITSSGLGIWVYSPDQGGAATLNITGENGSSLNASGSSNGIQVQSNSGDASLTIQNADVEATVSSVAGHGVMVQAGSSSPASLSVEDSSLTATGGSSSGLGIYFYVPSSSEKINLTVSNNALVRANGGIDSGDGGQAVTTDGTGIVFNKKVGTVYGNVTLQEDLTIGEGESLTLGDGATLAAGGHNVIVDGGTVDEDITTSLGDSVKYAPDIQTESLPNGTEGTSYSQTLTATGTTPITWSVSTGSLPAGLSLNSDGTITGTPSADSTFNFTVTASNAYGSDSKQFTLTIEAAANVPVESVSLNKTSTSLYVGEHETLTATVTPDNATNKDVTWESSNTSVATVDANGKVTAVAPGTATITVTAQSNNTKSDTCTVTVSRYSSGGSSSYTITTPDAENGTVRVSPSRASRGTTVTITVTPDEGYELESLTVLDSRDNEIALTDKGDGKYTFTMPSGKVTVEASFAEIAPEPLPFGDVDDGDWFADAVRFVYENGMMNGVSETDFAPHATTSRSMIVTILYRLEGEPVVDDAMDFSDVAEGAYYAEAVRWAAGEGIVGGYGGGLFGSDDAVTREQLAAILYRYAVYKGYDVSVGEDTNILSYADFADLSEYAIPAMQWACDAGIVNGTSESTLTPQGEATRAQVAAMLMRFCAQYVETQG